MNRSPLKKLIAGLAAASAVAAVAPAAQAATVSQSNGVLAVTAQPGETNNMRLTLTDTYLEVLENNSGGVTPLAGTTCIRFSPGHARCNLTGVSFVRVYGGDMHDYLYAELYGTRAFNMYGGTGNDYVDVAGTVDNRAFLYGEDGDDQVYGRQFGDTAYGGAGNDTIGLGDGSDTANGGPGADRIDTGAGNDFVYAKDSTRDVVACGIGTDWAQIDRSWYLSDSVSACETLAS